MEGKICDQVICISIDPRSNYSYINPDLVDKGFLNKEVHEKSWLVQLDIGTKKRVHHWVRSCAFEMNNMSASTHHLNMLPLRSYNILLGMYLLYIHRTKVYCCDKAIECLYDDG